MEDTKSHKTKLNHERDELAHAGSLHWFHWAIVILSAVLTITAWQVLSRQIDERTRSQFDREVSQTVELVTERMRKYEDALWSGVAALQANGGEMKHLQWRTFTESLELEDKYPGISGMGVIVPVSLDDLDTHLSIQRRTRPGYMVHPEHAQKELLPIMYIEPEEPNAKAVGLDIAHETNRYTAATKARDTGIANITGPIVLVQDEGQTPGFLFYTPYYSGSAHDTLQDHQKKFLGLVYAPFVVKKLLEGTLDKDKRSVGIRLSDNDEVLYDEHTSVNDDFDSNPQYTQRIEMEIYGRTWAFDIWSAKSFRQLTMTNQPIFVLVGGLTIDALLLALFLFLSRASRRTLSFADRMNVALLQQTEALTRSNADLESFAYVASHDLKTPLRGISDLTTYLEEDLEAYMSSPDANPDVHRNFLRLHQQTRRMDNLIRGILDYSSVGGNDEISTVDVAKFLSQIQSDLRIRDDQLLIGDLCPVFDTYSLQFEQVISNLVGNAFKYHHDRKRAVVMVTSREREQYYEFSVADNGPGIHPKFHARIFEVFQTLQSQDEIESTGIGLSIVKKMVEGLGGKVAVSSTIGKGTTFTFEWPKSVKTGQDNLQAVNL